jgi:hypothetical protein
MEDMQDVLLAVWSAVAGFFAWLGIHPTPQDFVKAIILTLFVLAILMIVGDVYRGEIQNKLHRVKLGRTSRGAALPRELRTDLELRRRLRRDGDVLCHVPDSLVPLPLNDIYSNVLFYFRYRDSTGRVRSKLIENYRSRFYIRKRALPQTWLTGHEDDHHYTEEENDQLSEEDTVTTISMAASRVDFIEFGRIEPLMENEFKKYEKLKANALLQRLSGITNGQVFEPKELGLAVKFHFPINPHFLLYKHPDTNVRTTAWLTVLTSVFALFMQLIFAGGTDSAIAASSGPPAIVRTIVGN